MPTYLLTIDDVSPNQDSIDVLRSTSINITFNRDLSPTTLAGNILLDKKVDNIFTNISGTISYSKKVATFIPSEPLDANTVYRVTVIGDLNGNDSIVTGIKDIFGNGMLGKFQYLFSTVDAPILIKPVIISPASNTTISNAPTISWSSINEALTYDIQISPSSDFSVDLWFTSIIDGSTSVTPNIVFIDGPYFCRMLYTTSNGQSEFSDTVRFYYSNIVSSSYIESRSLEVIHTSPLDKACNIGINTPLSITFNYNIDPDSISNRITLQEFPSGNIEVTITLNEDTITIVPTSSLLINKEYRIIVNNSISSIDGDELIYDYEYIFTTTYSPLYCEFSDVATDIYPITGHLPPHIIYKAIRDASINARELRTLVEASVIGSVPTDWTDTANLPFYIKQYVRYQAGYDTFLYAYMEKSSTVGMSKELGDFHVQSLLPILGDATNILRMLKERIKPWLDQLMNLGFNRGYATPKSAVRGENVSAYQSFHDRIAYKE